MAITLSGASLVALIVAIAAAQASAQTPDPCADPHDQPAGRLAHAVAAEWPGDLSLKSDVADRHRNEIEAVERAARSAGLVLEIRKF